MTDLYKKYKRIKNKIRATKLDESLYVVWNYTSFLYKRDINFFKNGVEAYSGFIKSDYIQQRRWLAEWDIQILNREIILNASEYTYKPKTFRKWKYFADTVNLIKDLNNDISKSLITTDNFFLELHRTTHRQFPWQIKNPNHIYITRYFKIFSNQCIKDIVEKKINLPINKFYLIVLIIYGFFLDKIAIIYPPNINVDDLSLEDFEKAIDFMSIKLENLKNKIREKHKVNGDFDYLLSQSSIYPLIKMNYFGNYSLVCPDSKLLFWRATDGLYYELFNEKNFDNPFGQSFEEYVGEVIEKPITKNIKYTKEIEYGSRHNRKKSSDWLIYDNKSILFIECKTKRMLNESKINISNTEYLYQDLNKMADFIIKVYKTIDDYKNNRYKDFPYKKELNIYPMIVTLENWHILGFTYQEIKRLAKEKLLSEKLPIEWISEMPFTICPIDTFEIFSQIINFKDIDSVMIKKINGQEEEWDLMTVLNNHFKQEVNDTKFLFREDFEKIFPKKYIIPK